MVKEKLVRFDENHADFMELVKKRCPLKLTDIDIVRTAMALLIDYANNTVDDDEDSMTMYSFIKGLVNK